MQYLFSALDMSFFAFFRQTALTEIVPDLFETMPEEQVDQLMSEFYQRMEESGLLRLEGRNMIVEEKLAQVLYPIFDGDLVVIHIDDSPHAQTPGLNALYITEKLGVTFVKRVKEMYELKFYSELSASHDDFLETFNLGATKDFTETPFYICEKHKKMEKSMKAVSAGNGVIDEGFLRRHQIDKEYFSKIVKVVESTVPPVHIHVGYSGKNKISGEIIVTLIPQTQYMARELIIGMMGKRFYSLESYSREGLLEQIISLEVKGT
jgi:hypothetical protein